jgi:hypothetical protein
MVCCVNIVTMNRRKTVGKFPNLYRLLQPVRISITVCGCTNKQGMIVSYEVSKRCDNSWGCDHTKIEYRCGTHPVKLCPVPDEVILLPE